MKIDRNKFLALALGVNILACAAPKTPDAEPAEQDINGQELTTPPAASSGMSQEGMTQEGMTQEGPMEECIDWDPNNECIAWEPIGNETYNPDDLDSTGPMDECIEWDPTGECINWEAN